MVRPGRSAAVADRGFGDHKLYRLLTEHLHLDYVKPTRVDSGPTDGGKITRYQ